MEETIQFTKLKLLVRIHFEKNNLSLLDSFDLTTFGT